MAENHLFILWENALNKADEILADMAQRFDVVNVYRMRWSPELFNENLSRFYGQKLPPGCHKEEHCGNGPFLLILVKDRQSAYSERRTTAGVERVNVSTFEAKQLYRGLTGGGHKIHGTNSPEETVHDATLLLGLDAERHFEVSSSSPTQIADLGTRDLLGARGWDTIHDMFRMLNTLTDYLVLRNFEKLPEAFFMDSHDDIDLLVRDRDEVAYLLNARRAFPQPYRTHFHVTIAGHHVPFDLRFVGDHYYTRPLQEAMLAERVFLKDTFYAPPAELYFYTLLYHALIHKTGVKADYRTRLTRMHGELTGTPPARELTDAELSALLHGFMRDRRWSYPRPVDLTVYYNEKFIPADAAIAEGDTIESALIELLSKNLINETTLREIRQNPALYYHLAPARGNLIRWLQLGGEKRNVLEIGAECGALTSQWLQMTEGTVAAVEPTTRRAHVVRERCKGSAHLTLHAGRLDTFETPERFDVVTLVGAFDRADKLGVEGKDPMAGLIAAASRFLKDDGVLLVAVDNPLSHKFTSHKQGYQGGYRLDRAGLKKALAAAGFAHQQWYYPYPDFLAPKVVFSEAALARPDFDFLAMMETQAHPRDGQLPLNERALLSDLAANQCVAPFMNAFLVLASRQAEAPVLVQNRQTLATKASLERAEGFRTQTTFYEEGGALRVLKQRLAPEAPSRFKHGALEVSGKPEVYHAGHAAMSDMLVDALVAGDLQGAYEVMLRWHQELEDLSSEASAEIGEGFDTFLREMLGQAIYADRHAHRWTAGRFLDLHPGNMLFSAEQRQIRAIDLEWVMPCSVPLQLIFDRGVAVLANTLYRFRSVIPFPLHPETLLPLAFYEQQDTLHMLARCDLTEWKIFERWFAAGVAEGTFEAPLPIARERQAAEAAALALNAEGEAHFAAGELEAAFAAFSGAVEHHPGFAKAHNNMGVVAWQQAEPALALACLERALALEEGNPDTLFNITHVLLTVGDTAKARVFLDAYLALCPDDAEARQLLAPSAREEEVRF